MRVILIPAWRRHGPPARVRVVALAAVCLVAAACSTGRDTSAAPGQLSVVANFYPIAQAAHEIGGDRVQVTNLTAPGVEPHDLELTPDQLVAISSADVVLYVGGGFQPAVQDAVGDASGLVVDVTADLRSLPVPPGQEQSLTADPHVWLDPMLYARVVDNEEQALAQAAPQDAAAFATNAASYRAKLTALDAEYRTGLAHCARDVIVTSHAAFGYLAQQYGLRQEAISGLSPDAEPSPQRLADLKALVERDGVTTIFTEDLVSPKVAQTLADETGATTAVLNPLESLTPDQLSAGDDYLSVMRSNLATLRTALDCT
jgi:zinc transport system substrate-binding protein